MLKWAVIFLIVALVAALLGFGGIAGAGLGALAGDPVDGAMLGASLGGKIPAGKSGDGLLKALKDKWKSGDVAG